MASLERPHWECLASPLRDVLVEVGRQPFAGRFYLAGGTALALQLGHRISVDLDFFSTRDELPRGSRHEIISALEKRFPLEVDEGGLASLILNVEESYVGFFGYSYPLLAPTLTVEGVKVAGLLDIGLMKMDAIAGRGARKDFYDLYFIARHIPLDELLRRGADKFPYVRDFGMMVLTALADYGVAERQADIEMLPPVSWPEVQEFFAQEIRRIGHHWFG